jgi:hypothetical protein
MFIIVVLIFASPQRKQKIARLLGVGAKFKYFNMVYFSGKKFRDVILRFNNQLMIYYTHIIYN